MVNTRSVLVQDLPLRSEGQRVITHMNCSWDDQVRKEDLVLFSPMVTDHSYREIDCLQDAY